MAEIDRPGANFSRSVVSGALDLLASDGKPALAVSSDERFAQRYSMGAAEDAVAPTAPAAPEDTAPRAAPEPAAPIAPPLQPPPVPPPADPVSESKPQRRQFDHPEDYDAALVQWGTRAALAEHDAKRQRDDYARRQNEYQHAQQKAVNDAWAARRQETITKQADYAEAEAALIEATNEFNGQQTAAMTATIMTTDDGPSLAYYLGKNTAEAKRIARIPDPALQLVELGKISAKLAQPKPAGGASRPASAPRAAAAPRAPRELTMEQYAAQKAAARAAARRDHRL